VSSLDVSIQAQILNLLKTLQKQFSLTYLFVTHDLGVVRHMSDRIAVMYRGRIVEAGPCETVSGRPAHPYTKALIAAVPGTDPSLRGGRGVAGAQTNSIDGTETGCIFQSRCPSRIEICKRCEPDLKQHGPSHWVACHGSDR
jgi:oligopeptide/dipeptide ABC transporter ATP-binding protein